MSNSRRNFIKQSGLAGIGVAGAWMSSYAGTSEDLDRIKEAAAYTPPQTFNMSGYAAPKLDTVRVGFVGIGNRGFGNMAGRRICAQLLFVNRLQFQPTEY